jgi:hypothetical protein
VRLDRSLRNPTLARRAADPFAARRADPFQKDSSPVEAAMLDYFDRLGTLVQERWRSKHFDDACFTEVATEALRELSPAGAVDMAELVRWAVTTDHFVAQKPVEGAPYTPLCVYNHELFFIEVLFWLDGSPRIHEHRFSGAFHVLAGSSVHTRYDFEVHERVNARMLLGDLRLRDVEYLAAGDTRPIVAGPRLIHATFHLDRPSVSVRVITRVHYEAMPRYTYFKPTLAYAGYKEGAREQTTCQLELLSLLREIGHPDHGRLLGELIARADFETTFLALWGNLAHLEARAAEAHLEQARRRHGTLVDYLPPLLDEDRRVATLTARRRSVRDPDHRFLLALLFNLPDRASILDFVRRRYEGDPADRIVMWLAELTRLPGAAAAEPNALGIHLNDVSLQVVRCLLDGCSFEGTKERLKENYPAAAVDGQEKELRQLCADLRQSTLFKPLFADGKQDHFTGAESPVCPPVSPTDGSVCPTGMLS